MNRVTAAVLGTFVVILVATGILTYVLREPSQPTAAPAAATAPATGTQPRAEIPLLGQLFGPDATGLMPATISSWEATSARIALRFYWPRFWQACWHFDRDVACLSRVVIRT